MFITDSFLLKNKTAKTLYNKFARDLPIIDYHCHINPAEIAENRTFNNITEVWLGGDHYKWRLMRSNGVSEQKITGDAPDFEKFSCFAAALTKAIGNPMYHWCHLELKKYFGFNGILNESTAKEVFELANAKLKTMPVRTIIENSNVRFIGTTDDPTDTLNYHKQLMADKSFKTTVAPTFRPDKAVNIDKPGFAEYIAKLATSANIEIKTAEDVMEALKLRLNYFCELGCKATDHGLDYIVYSPAESTKELNKIFAKALKGEPVSQSEADIYKTEIMLFLGREIAKKNIVMQLHFGAQRNTNSKMFEKLGADTGFDCISVKDCSAELTGFLNALEKDDLLPKTIIYSLNPNDNEMIDTVLGCFQSDTAVGKIQHGAAWWFSDTKSGMEEHMKSLANLSLLGNFIGMLTDSRSFLSYTRHDYFRRILCSVIGEWAENGEYPCDISVLGNIVKDICYYNAARYFGIE